MSNEIIIAGRMDNTMDNTFESANRVYDVEGIAPTVNCCGGGGLQTMILEENCVVAMRGRGENNEQRLELNLTGNSNTITTVQKDNLIVEKEPRMIVENIEQTVRVRKNKVDVCGLQKLLKEHKTKSISQIAEALKVPKTKVEHWFRTDSSFSIPDENVWFDLKKLLKIQTNEYDKQIMEFEIKNNVYEKSNRCYSSEGISPTLTAADNNIKTKIGYRIRKLTPRECWRLMSFTDDDFEKAQKVNSNTQLYKQAGNSIVVKVLEAIFRQLL